MAVSGLKVCGVLLMASRPPLLCAQDFIVRLATPLSASNSRKGDAVRATVASPAAFQGDTLQGQITEVKGFEGPIIPAVRYDTPDGRAQNRRVEFLKR